MDLNTLSDTDIIIRTIDGEAANQGIPGMRGVGCVIQNRARIGGWWGDTPREVCLVPDQFDCWMAGEDLDRITASDYAPPEGAADIATMVLAGILADVTGGATSYFDDSIPPPRWADPEEFTVKIGTLNFYKVG